MKKRIMIAFILLSLVGCQNINSTQEGKKEDNIIQEDQNQETIVTRMDFIEETFKSHNFNAPDKSHWQINEEGPNKVAVIIKQPVAQQKPLITKLIFIDNGSYTIEFLQIENKIIIK